MDLKMPLDPVLDKGNWLSPGDGLSRCFYFDLVIVMVVMMVIMIMVAVVSLTTQVFLGLFVKGGFAARGAKIVHLPIVFRRPLGGSLVDFHFTYWIDCHNKPRY